jgi:hypothetical protein
MYRNSKNYMANILLLLVIVIVLCIIFLFLQQRIHLESFLEHMIVPNLKAGLGNQLFELSTAYSLSKELNKHLKLHSDYIQLSVHSPINYMDTIFAHFKDYITHDKPETQISPNITASDCITLSANKTPAELTMYNQDWKKIHRHRNDFIKLLKFNDTIGSKYSLLDSSAFIHFRGGDYKGMDYLNVPLVSYYKNALELLKKHNVEHIYVFTNDKTYASSFDILNSFNHTYVDENEYDSLYLMSRCAKGGICSNSTFSWWGLYLNLDRPYLIMPKTWIVDEHRPSGFYPDFHFPGATIIDNV